MAEHSQVVELQHANDQRKAAEYATLNQLLSKKRRRKTISVVLNDDEDPRLLRLVAISPKDYDTLVSKHQPTEAQAAKGSNINPDTFCPALVALVCQDPKLSEDEWKQVWADPEWGKGELSSLYWEANDLCNRSLTITPFESG
jgi:hypothetical protein